jgi:hypothetical protein
MDNYFSLSPLNPLNFVFKDRALLPQYNTKFSDEFLDQEARKPWQGAGRYYQKWQTNDRIFLQGVANVGPINFTLYDCRGVRVGAPLAFTQVRQNRYIPGMFIYQVSHVPNVPKGRYRYEITVGNPVTDILEIDYIDIAPQWPNTVLLEYSNSFYYGDGIFATGWEPSFRVEGWFKQMAPASKDELYQDQALNQRMLFSDPYTVRKFIIGPPGGVPDWLIEKLNWILGCDELFIDGKAFTKADGAKFQEEEIDGHPFRGWSIDLQETNRRSSKVFPVDPSVGGKKLIVALNVEAQGFADTTTGNASNVIQITSVE